MSKSLGGNFGNEFYSDADVDEAIDLIGKMIMEEESLPSVENEAKIEQIKFSYNVLRYMTQGTGIKVMYKLHEPFKSMGSVSIIGKNITFSNPDWFLKVAEYASNVEAYPRTDGVVQINFTFHGITKPIR